MRRPEEEHDEEISAAEEGDEKDEQHGSFGFAEELPRNHGVGRVDLPREEGGDQHEPDDEGSKDVCATPGVLSSSSVKHTRRDQSDEERGQEKARDLPDASPIAFPS